VLVGGGGKGEGKGGGGVDHRGVMNLLFRLWGYGIISYNYAIIT